ncbi:27kDa outer membrane protein [Caenispirillum salinarum AK4]|uniref:27kDa outer membrane protein n=1 Tax=Caenispirillum salinarum AK4 TaxID=1238182 RepID=K9HJU7_9PROT|nr:DsbA family protein [Caenispirillum salinarum]EKV28876.1 27kDa outer membrane protein [Caenispirillum salinarum AK4]
MRRTAALLTLLTVLAPAPAALAEPAAEKAEMEAVVRDLLRREPELVVEALTLFQAKQKAEAELAKQRVLTERADEIFRNPDDPITGNPDGDVTVVEFFDYQCPYCKRVEPIVQELLEGDGNIRYVSKEFPILGPESVFAARAALASREQDLYQPFSDRLMEHGGDFTEEAVMSIAREVGLDVDQLRGDMAAQSGEIDRIISRNRALAQDLGITGTPAFVIGERLIPGAVDLATLEKAVADVRENKTKKGATN